MAIANAGATDFNKLLKVCTYVRLFMRLLFDECLSSLQTCPDLLFTTNVDAANLQ